MSFTSRNISYNLNSEVAWEIGFDEIAGKLWGDEYTVEEKNIELGQFSLETYTWSLSAFNGNQDNDFFEINDSGTLYWYFEDGGYDFDYESINDSNQDNEYEIIANAFDENSDLVAQQHLKISIYDIDDTAAGISVKNGNLEEIATDENDYFRELEHNVSYDWKANTKLISNYSADQVVTWTFDTKSDEKYYQISSSGVLKYKALPEFFTASIAALTPISETLSPSTDLLSLIPKLL